MRSGERTGNVGRNLDLPNKIWLQAFPVLAIKSYARNTLSWRVDLSERWMLYAQTFIATSVLTPSENQEVFLKMQQWNGMEHGKDTMDKNESKHF